MYCIECGTTNVDDARFCVKCGKDLREEIIRRERRVNIVKTIVVIGLLIASLSLIIFIPKNQNNINMKDVNIIAPTIGTLEVLIASVPSNASIYINNVFEGRTPQIINLSTGNYSLMMNLTGYKNIVTDFNITSGDIKNSIRQEVTITMDRDESTLEEW